MSNLTSRLAINIRYLPDFSFSWSDCTPQQPRSSLTISDFLPSEVDAAILKERATQYMMTFVVDTFTDLKPLSKLIPPVQPNNPIIRSHVVPMKILFLNEKYEWIFCPNYWLMLGSLVINRYALCCYVCIVIYIMTIAGSGGRPAHIRGCKRWRVTETDPKSSSHGLVKLLVGMM